MRILNLLASGNLAGIEKLNIDIFERSSHEHLYCFMFKGGMAADILKEKQAFVNVLDLKFKHWIVSQYKAIKRIVLQEEINAIIVHHETPIAWIIASKISKNMHIPFYIYSHCEYKDIVGFQSISKAKYLYKKYAFKYALKNCRKVIAVSNFVKNSIISRYPEVSNKINVVYNGVDLSIYSAGEQDNEVFTIIYVGRLVKQKGVHILLESLKYIDSCVKCIIVGDGSERENLEKIVGINKQERIIEFVGAQKNTTKWYKKADIFVHPATWEEGFGITIIEAMASGLPCISFNKGALPEIIENDINGAIVDDCNSKELAVKISDFIDMKKNSTASFNSFKVNAMRRAKDFDIKKTIKKLDRILDNL